MILINLTDNHIQLLLKCKNTTKDRCFNDWNIEGLLNEAIYEFYEKYGKETKRSGE